MGASSCAGRWRRHGFRVSTQVDVEDGQFTQITSYPNTPLLRHTDLALVTAVSETLFRVRALASRIAHLTIIDAPYTALAEEDPARSREHLELTNAIIEQKRIARTN